MACFRANTRLDLLFAISFNAEVEPDEDEVLENLGTLAFNAAVDAGYTNVSTIDSDPARYGKSVVRKTKNGKLVDTNNSTNDFEISTTPSMK